MNKAIIIASTIIGFFILLAVIVNNNYEQNRLREEQAVQAARLQSVTTCIDEAEKGLASAIQNKDSFCTSAMEGLPYTNDMCSDLISAAIKGHEKVKQRCYETYR